MERKRRININKAKSCASCELDYSKKRWSDIRRWCRQCGVYICKECAEGRKCPKCEKRVRNILSFGLFWLVILMVFIVPFFVFGMSDYIEEQPLVDMEVTDISQAEIGDQVKIFGIINSTNTVVISGHYEGSGRNRDWVWEPSNFFVDDETGTIWVDSAGLWQEEGSSRIKSGIHNDDQYWNGDEICIIGTVEDYALRGKTIRADYIGKDPGDFGSNSGIIVLIFAPLFIMAIMLWIVGGFTLIKRRKKHMENFEGFTPKKEKPKDEGKGAEMAASESPSAEEPPWSGDVKKEGWKEFNLRRSVGLGVVVIYMFVIIMAIASVLVLYPDVGMQGSDYQGMGICISIWLLGIGGGMSFFTYFYLRRRRNQSTIIYRIKKGEVGYLDIDDTLDNVFRNLGLMYKKEVKEVIKGKAYNTFYEMGEKGGKVILMFATRLDGGTILNIRVRPGSEDNILYHRRVKTDLEAALDEFFELD